MTNASEQPKGWNITWHSPSHGSIQALTRHEADDFLQYINREYHVNSKAGAWFTRDSLGLWSCEFHVHPYAGRFPWSLDGRTYLFTTWKEQEDSRFQLQRTFVVGTRVTFTDRDGNTHTGVISGGRKRATVIIPGSSAKWHVPYHMLRRADPSQY